VYQLSCSAHSEGLYRRKLDTSLLPSGIRGYSLDQNKEYAENRQECWQNCEPRWLCKFPALRECSEDFSCQGDCLYNGLQCLADGPQ
jgi:hypothetical protein